MVVVVIVVELNKTIVRVHPRHVWVQLVGVVVEIALGLNSVTHVQAVAMLVNVLELV